MTQSRTGSVLLTVLTASMIWLSGCTPANLLQAPASETKTYLLGAEPDVQPINRSTGKVLLVAEPRAEPGFDTPYIAYTRDPLSLDYYTKSEWADTPGKMLHPLIVMTMEKTNAFRAVVTPPTPANPDLRLEIDIIRLQQEFWEKPSRVRLTLRAKLFEPNSGQVLATQLFEATEPAPSEDAEGGVRAANKAVEKVLEELAGFVMEHGA